jgi:hypothetical protein
VEVRVNSDAWHDATNTGTNFSTWAYDATLASAGDYTIQSRATDSFGAVEVFGAGITVHVSTNLPTVQITKPTQNEWITQESYPATGVTTAPTGTTITKVEVTINGTNWAEAVSTGTNFSSWSYTLTDLTDGRYILESRATNSLGLVSASYAVTFGIDRTAPSKPDYFSAFNVSNHIAAFSQALLWWQASTDKTSGIKEYQLFRGTEIIATIANTNNYYIDTNPKSGRYQVKAIDNAGNVTSSEEAALDLTVSAPKLTIADVRATPSKLLDPNGKSSALITWKTDQPSTSLVYYGLGGAKANQAGIDNQLNFSHSVVLTDLDPNTVYHFAVLSKSAYGTSQTSADQIFTSTSNASVDTVWNKIIKNFQRPFEWFRKAVDDPILNKLGLLRTPEQISPQMTVFNVSVPPADSYQSFISYSGDNGFTLERSTDGENFTTLAKESGSNYYFDQNLYAKTTYYYRAKDVSGLVSVRTSGKDTTPPFISRLTTNVLGQNKKSAEVVISYQTDKPSSSTVNINDKSYQDEALNQSHMVLVDNLNVGQNYNYTVTSVSANKTAATLSSNLSVKEIKTNESVWQVATEVIQNKYQEFAAWMRE